MMGREMVFPTLLNVMGTPVVQHTPEALGAHVTEMI